MFNTQRELDEYRSSINAKAPEICEVVLYPDWTGKERRERVVAYFCPHVTKPLPVHLAYRVNIPTGRGRYVYTSRAYVSARAYSNIATTHRKRLPRVSCYDSSKWMRNYVEKQNREIVDQCRERGEVLLRFCTKEEATHVEIVSVGGNIVRIDKVKPTGELVSWSQDMIAESRERSLAYADREQYLMDAVRVKA